ncbi:hypothetical protein OBBRIDRAFT_513020 [Obba rivulosa]|uniref:Shieldin complex subunit 2 first OB fold domain-containing protein n=1 Tax=Obba rivulosa TaxID=1052685 RepID=A0A8E2AVE6_9APHY|nr:hypothetical protein OBBRIDRAFT_513020 [Obba rivulosa]
MTRFRVFLGAPSADDLGISPKRFQWQTVSSGDEKPCSLALPPATLEAASRRITSFYQNIIFESDDEEILEETSPLDAIDVQEETTVITWPPTVREPPCEQDSSRPGPSSMRPTAHTSLGRSQHQTQFTQETMSYDYSDASSIARFPVFHFKLHDITSLFSIVEHARALQPALRHQRKASQKVNLLVAVLEVDGPDTIRVKKGPDAGNEVSVLKMILGDEDGAVCKLTVWREVAELWGGAYLDASCPAIKRGDIVLMENVLVSCDVGPHIAAEGASGTAHVNLTASPNLKSTLMICYRTMPNTHEDSRFRPDLRLGFSDAAVRKVTAIVDWFEKMAGLHIRN